MNKFQYRRAMMALGLNQQTFADKLNVSIRSSNGYANGAPIPDRVITMIELLLEKHARDQGGAPEAKVTLSRRPVQIVRGRPAGKPTKPLAPAVFLVDAAPGAGKTAMVKRLKESAAMQGITVIDDESGRAVYTEKRKPKPRKK